MNTKKLNRLWSTTIKNYFKGICLSCYGVGTDPHHLIKRNTYGLKYKWHPLNGVLLCRECHQTVENYGYQQTLAFIGGSLQHCLWYIDACVSKTYVDLSEEEIITQLESYKERSIWDEVGKI